MIIGLSRNLRYILSQRSRCHGNAPIWLGVQTDICHWDFVKTGSDVPLSFLNTLRDHGNFSDICACSQRRVRQEKNRKLDVTFSTRIKNRSRLWTESARFRVSKQTSYSVQFGIWAESRIEFFSAVGVWGTFSYVTKAIANCQGRITSNRNRIVPAVPTRITHKMRQDVSQTKQN